MARDLWYGYETEEEARRIQGKMAKRRGVLRVAVIPGPDAPNIKGGASHGNTNPIFRQRGLPWYVRVTIPG